MNKLQKAIIKLTPHPILVEDLIERIVRHGGLKITGFGIFKLKKTKGTKNGYNLYTKKRDKFSPRVKVTFRPVKKFKTAIQKWHK